MFGAYCGEVSRGKKIAIIVSAKAGCTTVHRMCQRLFSDHFDRVDARYFIRNIHISIEKMKQWLEEEYGLFIVVRNPYDRIISCFYNKFVNYNGKQIRSDSDLEHFSRDLLSKSGLDLLNYNGLSFKEFVEILKTYHWSDHHWDRQFSFQRTLPDEIVQNLQVIQLETFSVEARRYFDFEEDLPLLNQTTLPKSEVTLDASDILSIDLDRYYDRKSLISEEVKQIIDDVYHKDFQYGRYQKIV